MKELIIAIVIFLLIAGFLMWIQQELHEQIDASAKTPLNEDQIQLQAERDYASHSLEHGVRKIFAPVVYFWSRIRLQNSTDPIDVWVREKYQP